MVALIDAVLMIVWCFNMDNIYLSDKQIMEVALIAYFYAMVTSSVKETDPYISSEMRKVAYRAKELSEIHK